MAALTTAVTHVTRSRGLASREVAGSNVIFSGALVGLDVTTGDAIRWDNPAGNDPRFLGIATLTAFDIAAGLHQVTGGSGQEVEVNEQGIILVAIAVAGTPAAGELVYSATDNVADITDVATGGADPIGRILGANGSGWDVRLFDEEEARSNLA